MKRGARIVVTSGVHDGASVALSSGHELKIGSGKDADLILIDDDVATHHATVCLRDGKLALQAIHEGVAVFGFPLKPAARAALQYGGWFSIGAVTLQFTGDGLPDVASTQRAELAWLLRHAPLAWLARRWALAPRPVRLAIAAMPLAAALWQGWQLIAQHAPNHPPAYLENPAFKNVRAQKDATSGVTVYEGYVQSAADLAALSIAARANSGRHTMRVAVIDTLREQLADLLARYYRDARLVAREPGAFVATLPSGDAYLQPDSWDYARVARIAREQVDGLGKLEFAGHEADTGPAKMPLSALGLNLLHSPHAAWLTDAQGTRYFVGAHIAIGRVVRITQRSVSVERDDGTPIDLFISHADEQ